MDEYSPEIRIRPLPVVALMGCSDLHPHIVASFSTVMLDPVPTLRLVDHKLVPRFHCISLELGAGLPNRKQNHRQTYEGYIAQGLVKAKWLHKHTHVLPAVLILFLAWDGTERDQTIVATIESVKTHCRVRNIRLVVSMVVKGQWANDLPTFRRVLDNPSNLVVFDRDDVPGSTRNRLERVVYELALNYYRDEARRLKKLKDSINKRTQPHLYVRVHFKIGLYAEFRFDVRASLKYYLIAYTYLREVPKDRRNISQIKYVADLLNFKICKHYLTLGNALSETISQFHRHMQLYKGAVRAGEREYEHWEWVSRQYKVFGTLLDMYVPNCTAVSGLRHPGYYYHASASYAMQRQRSAVHAVNTSPAGERIRAERSNDPSVPPLTHAGSPVPSASILPSSGAMPIDPSTLGPNSTTTGPSASTQPTSANNPAFAPALPPSLPTSGPTSGAAGVADPNDPSHGADTYLGASQWDSGEEPALRREISINHTKIIIDLLTKAYNKYKNTSSSSRMILYLASLMAQEHFRSGDFDMAKRFYDRIAKKYKKEQWWSILTRIFRNALFCARQLKLPSDFILYSAELLVPQMQTSPTEKQTIQRNLLQVLQNPTSMPMPALEKPVELEMISHLRDDKRLLMQCKVQVGASKQEYARIVFPVSIQLTSNLPLPLKFNTMSVYFSDDAYDRVLGEKDCAIAFEKGLSIVGDDTPNPNSPKHAATILQPGIGKVFMFELTVSKKAILRCTKVGLSFGGDDPNSNLNLYWNIGLRAQHQTHLAVSSTSGFVDQTQIEIRDPEAKLEIEVVHHPPAFVNEHYPLLIRVHNKDHGILSGNLLLDLTDGPPDWTADQSFFSAPPPNAKPQREIPVPAVAAGSCWEQAVYVYSPKKCGTRHIHVKLGYNTAEYATSVVKSFLVPVSGPFAVSPTFFTPSNYHKITPQSGAIVVNDPFLIGFEVQCLSPYPLQLLDSTFIPEESPNPKDGTGGGGGGGGDDGHDGGDGDDDGRGDASSDGGGGGGDGGGGDGGGGENADHINLTSSGRQKGRKGTHSTAVVLSPVVSVIPTLTQTGAPPPAAKPNQRLVHHASHDVVFSEGDRYMVWCRATSPFAGNAVSLGKFKMTWRRSGMSTLALLKENCKAADKKLNVADKKSDVISRKGDVTSGKGAVAADKQDPPCEIDVTVPPLRIARSPFSTKMQVPPHGVVGSPITISVTITNHTQRLEDFRLLVNESPSFLFAGTRRSSFKILPFASYCIQHVLVPVESGKLKLPKLQLTSHRFSTELAGTKQSRFVFVRPHA